MRNFFKKRGLFYIVFTAIFLLVIPFAVCRAADVSSQTLAAGKVGFASGKNSITFHKNVTVEMLQEQLAVQNKKLRVAVFGTDGNPKVKGNIVTGDVIKTIDSNENILSTVYAIVMIDGSSSSVPESYSSVPESSSSVPPGKESTVFAETVTMENLTKQMFLQAQYDGFSIKVSTPGGKHRVSGCICTGDTICVLDEEGNTKSNTKVIVLGDLTRCGTVTGQGCGILYDYLVCNETLDDDVISAADINRDGTVNTSDLLKMKKALSENSKNID